MGNYNSSALAKQVAVKLNLSQADELALYKELSQISNGPVKDALAALSETPGKRKYVGLIRGCCVRDAQYAVREDAEYIDEEGWRDVEDIPLFLGFVEAESEIRARQLLAVQERVDESVIEVKSI